MDYANEEWIKVYVRSTAAWRCTSLAARGLALELSREMGRFCDEIHLGSRGLSAIAGLVNAPWEEVGPLLEELLRDGRLVYDRERQVLIDPEHMARQRAVSSPAQRQRDSRRGRTVTPCHAPSRDVTPCHDQREEIREIRERDARAREVADAPEPEPSRPPPASPRDDLPVLEEPLPDRLRERAAGLADSAGAPELDVRASWTNYVAWCVEQRRPVDEARWARWVNDDCSRLKRDRVRDLARERSGPRLALVRPQEPPQQPYHRAFAAPVDEEAPAAREHALEAARRLAAGDFRA